MSRLDETKNAKDALAAIQDYCHGFNSSWQTMDFRYIDKKIEIINSAITLISDWKRYYLSVAESLAADLNKHKAQAMNPGPNDL